MPQISGLLDREQIIFPKLESEMMLEVSIESSHEAVTNFRDHFTSRNREKPRIVLPKTRVGTQRHAQNLENS
jgi:hypothetical protein